MRPDCLTRWYAPRSDVEAGARNEAFPSGKSVRLRWPCPAHLFIWWKEAAFGDFCPRARSSPRLRESSPWHWGQTRGGLPLHEPESVNSLSCTVLATVREDYSETLRVEARFRSPKWKSACNQSTRFAISICNLWRNTDRSENLIRWSLRMDLKESTKISKEQSCQSQY